MATPFAALLEPQPDARTALAEGETESPETATTEVTAEPADGAAATSEESAVRQSLVADSATNLSHSGAVGIPELSPAGTASSTGGTVAAAASQAHAPAPAAATSAGTSGATELPVAVTAPPASVIAEAPEAPKEAAGFPVTAKPEGESPSTSAVSAEVSEPPTAPSAPSPPPSPAETATPIAELHDPAAARVPVASGKAPDAVADAPVRAPAPNTAEALSPPVTDRTPDRPNPAASPQPVATPAAPSTPTAAPASMSPAPTATGSTAAPSATAGAAAPSPSAALGETIRLAASQNFTRARLTLRPAELGSVEVLIATRGEGLAASLVAETPEAARLLESAGADLRRRLETQGLELHALYISVSQDGPAESGERQSEKGPAGTPGGDPGNERKSSTQPTRTIELGGGVLIDVLA